MDSFTIVFIFQEMGIHEYRTNYILTVKDLNKPIGTLVTLYDQQRNRIACSKIGTEIVSAISFPCNATGIYYIQYTFNPGAGRCGGASLAFKR